MKSKIFFRWCSAVSVVLLGVIYTGLAALHACTRGACWAGFGPDVSFSVIAAAMGSTQIMPCIMALVLMCGLCCCKCLQDEQEQEVEGDLVCLGNTIFAVIITLVPLTTGVSFGGLASLRACAFGKCYPGMSTPTSLAMFLSGQIMNFLVVIIYFFGALTEVEDSHAIQSVQDFWSTKRRRRVCNFDNAALPA
jgi:hypothetical protein